MVLLITIFGVNKQDNDINLICVAIDDVKRFWPKLLSMNYKLLSVPVAIIECKFNAVSNHKYFTSGII